MGNYYEGSLRFRFNNEVDQTLLNDLKVLTTTRYDEKDISNFSNAMRNSKWFSHPRAFYPHYTIYEIYDVNGEKMTFVDEDEDCGWHDEFAVQQRLELKRELAQHTLIGYELEVSICMKHFLENFDLGKALVEYFKPYVDINLYEDNNGGFIGNVNDEDCTYYEDFYINETECPIIEERKPICAGCCVERQSSTCCHYYFCQRAYELGQASVKVSGEEKEEE